MTAEARAKLLLFGEHSAVYGHPAIGLSLPWSLTVVHTSGPVWDLRGLGPYQTTVRALLERLEALAEREGRSPLPQGRLEFFTNIPIGTGFGSSGALCACLVNLFFPTLTLFEKDRLAWLAEAMFHGTPSGIDTALALRQGWWVLDASTRPVLASPLPDPGLVLVVGAVTRQDDTKGLVGSLARRRHEGEPLVLRTLADLGETSSEAAALLKAGRPGGIAPLVNRARQGLQTLGLETPVLTRVLETGLACSGATAGKLSGAGGGGAFFLVFDSEAMARQAIPVIDKAVESSFWTARPQMIKNLY